MKPNALSFAAILFFLLVSSLSLFAQFNFFRPEIVGQTPTPLRTIVNQPITIQLTNLIVTDGDSWQVYPNDFSLDIRGGWNYWVDGLTITPHRNFVGTLRAQVRVNDGIHYSRNFDLLIEVTEFNAVPEITGQSELTTNEDNAFTLNLSHIQVRDPDNEYPTDFSLSISAGPNYSVNDLTITPAQNFTGPLSISIVVNDGQANSQPYALQLNVNPVNDPPVIVGQAALNTLQDTPIPILHSHLIVNDPDNRYPDNFSMKIYPGNNYSFSGSTITPLTGFFGELTVGITVFDGTVESAIYNLKVKVEEVKNVPPEITGQKAISIVENTSLLILLSHLIVKDPDSRYPADFTLKVLPGDNYTVDKTTIRPVPNFKKNLSVRVTVHDGKAESPVYMLNVEVTPLNVKPKITGQQELTMMEDTVFTVSLGHLQVSDADNPGYPKGFSLIIMPANGTVYSAVGNTISPALNLNGFIDVGVKVSDGKNISDEFKLSILVMPVNDAPEIIAFDSTMVTYEPDKNPINLFEILDLEDVDNDYLNLAEIGFRLPHYKPENDELIMTSDSSKIKAIYDPAGILFLVGYATLEEYKAAIRSIQYNYQLIKDENGNYQEVFSSDRTIYIRLHDGQLASETFEKKITIETEVVLDIPNTFTPNGDQSNDTWQIRATNLSKLDKAILRVYNKRGFLLYESEGLKTEWDGVSAGQLLPVDTYYYTIDLNLAYLRKTYKGVVMILH